MHARKLRIVKPPLPVIGICEACNSQFKSDKRSQDEEEQLASAREEDEAHKLADELAHVIWLKAEMGRRIVRVGALAHA